MTYLNFQLSIFNSQFLIMYRYILLLLSIFSFSYHLSAQKIITVGIGYALDEKDKPFYAPIILQNDAPSKVIASVGEPIISLDGKNLAFYGEVIRDSAALLAKKKELTALFESCTECIFRTVNPINKELRIFDGYPDMFRFSSDMDTLFMQRDKIQGGELGFLGFTYKMQLKPYTAFVFCPTIQDIKPMSPAEKAGLKVGDILTAIVYADGTKESLYNTPLLWVIQKMKGPAGETCTLIINETETKTLKRANLIGGIENPQIINNCLSGDCKNGAGKLDNGREIYIGEFDNYKYEGKGKLYRSDRLAFEGLFLAGQKNGIGIDYQSDGTIVETSYIKGKSGNTLKYTKPNGFVYFEVWNGVQKSLYDKSMNPMTNVELQEKMGAYKPSTSIPENTSSSINTSATSIITPPAVNPPRTPVIPPPTTVVNTKTACTYCKGTGVKKQLGTCPAPDCVNGNVICTVCKGTGKYKDAKGKNVTCLSCHYVSPELQHAQDCKVCNGTGTAAIGEKPCTFCKGTGYK